jgi:signal peptidase complex subunit 3
MHTAWHRVNAVLTYFATIAAALCALTAFADVLVSPSPTAGEWPPAKLAVREVRRLALARGKHDQALLGGISLDADLRRAFNWNTKQLFVTLRAEYSTPQNALNQVRERKSRLFPRRRLSSEPPLFAPKLAPHATLPPPLPHDAKIPAKKHPHNKKQRKKQKVVLWDAVVASRPAAHLKLPDLKQEYPFLDQGNGLRGNKVNLTLAWHVMPRVGALREGSVTFPGAVVMPSDYTASAGGDGGAAAAAAAQQEEHEEHDGLEGDEEEDDDGEDEYGED